MNRINRMTIEAIQRQKAAKERNQKEMERREKELREAKKTKAEILNIISDNKNGNAKITNHDK